jgi:hypothetical protein
VGLLLAFATLVHDPRAYWIPAKAGASYADLRATLSALPGPVYAPGIGQFPDGDTLIPAAHWVALDDIMRGPHRSAADSTLARTLLDGAAKPGREWYVLTNHPLGELAPPVNELASSFVLVKDFGDRFATLRTLPRRFDQGYPRYLYRNKGDGALSHGP